MSLPEVAQAQMLGALLRRFVEAHRPQSLAVLGAAGGNGLELVDPTIVKRIVAVDVNAGYLATCGARFAERFDVFESVTHDLDQDAPNVAAVDAVFAGLILEYVPLDAFCAGLAKLVTRGGTVAIVTQEPSPSLPEVSESPYGSMKTLASAFRCVSPESLTAAMTEAGFAGLHQEQIKLESGKTFTHTIWRTASC